MYICTYACTYVCMHACVENVQQRCLAYSRWLVTFMCVIYTSRASAHALTRHLSLLVLRIRFCHDIKRGDPILIIKILFQATSNWNVRGEYQCVDECASMFLIHVFMYACAHGFMHNQTIWTLMHIVLCICMHKALCVWVGRVKTKAKQFSLCMMLAFYSNFSQMPYFVRKNGIPFFVLPGQLKPKVL